MGSRVFTTHRLNCLMVLGCPLLILFVDAAFGRTINIASITSKIVIDGNIDDAWNNISWHDGFLEFNNVTKQNAHIQTRFKIAYDKLYLYLLIQSDEPQANRLKAIRNKRDSDIWLDDSIELFVDPSGTRKSFYQIVVNSKGILFDARWIGGTSNLGWNSNIKAVSRVLKDHWIVELAIPFCEMDIPYHRDAKFCVNIARNRHADGNTEISSYSHALGSLPLSKNFVSTSLPIKSLLQSQFDSSYYGDIRAENGKYYYFVQFSVRRHGGKKSRKLTVVLTGKLNGVQIVEEEFVWWVKPDGINSHKPMKIPLNSGINEFELFAETYLDKKDGPCIHRHRFFSTLDVEPLTIRFLRPGYRDSIYATQDLKNIEIEASSLYDLPGMILDVSLRNSQKKELISKTVTFPRNRHIASVTLPISKDLAVGTYFIHSVLKNGEGKELARKVSSVKKLPTPEGNEVRIDEKMALRINGKPFLPIGYFSVLRDNQLSAEGCNSYIEYNSQYRGHDNEWTKSWLDEFHRQGIKVVLYPFPSAAIRKRGNAQKRSDSFTAEDMKAIRAYVDRWRKHPAVLAWYLVDEPEIRLSDPKNFEDLYQLLRKVDPYHPCIMLNDTITGIHTYSGGGDILMPDPYPLFLIEGHASRGIHRITDFLQAVAKHHGKQAWLVPQVFNYGDYGQKNNRQPTFVELRNMFYQGVAANAKGFQSFVYSALKVYPELKVGMPAITRELSSLQKAILAYPRNDSVQIDTNPPKANIVYTLRNVGKDVYLFVVNNETKDVGIDVNCPEIGDRTLFVVSENRRRQGKRGQFLDNLGPYNTHIYTTSNKHENLQSIDKIQERIKQEYARRIKPGNLAVGAKGIVSSSRGASELHINDNELTQPWEDDTKNTFPDTVTLKLSSDREVKKIVLTKMNFSDLEVEGLSGKSWKPLYQGKNNTQRDLQIEIPPTRLRAVRITISRTMEVEGKPEPRSKMAEIELY